MLFFFKRFRIVFNLINLLNVLDFFGLKIILCGIVDDVIVSFVVLFNRIMIFLVESVDFSDL